MSSTSNLIARVVSLVQAKRTQHITKVLIILTIVFMVMSGGEPAYAEFCPRC